jgi:hypothetical protein
MKKQNNIDSVDLLFMKTTEFRNTMIDMLNDEKDRSAIESAIKIYQSISERTLGQLRTMETYKKYILDFLSKHNSNKVDNVKLVQELLIFVDRSLSLSIEQSKRADTRTRRIKQRTIVMNWFKSNKNEFKKMFDLKKYLDKIVT